MCAIGRLCSNRTMNRSFIKTILSRVWGLSEKVWGVEIKHTSKNAIFLVFSFKSSQDLNRILIKNPWFLNNGTLILERMKEIPLNWDSCLSRIQLSGRILSLPPKSITQRNLERLAGFGTWLKVDEKKDIADIFGKGKLGTGSNATVGRHNYLDNRITNSIHLRKAQEQGSIKQSDVLIPSEKSVAHNTQESGTEDMEVIVEMGPSMIDKTVGQKPDLLKGNPQLSGGINLINHKRNGDWREDLMGNLPSNLEILNSIDTQVSTTIQKTNTLETVQLFEVPVTYESKLNISGMDEGKSKRRKITPKRLKNSGSLNTGLYLDSLGHGNVRNAPCCCPKDSHQKPTQDKVCWSPPPLGSFMINTDASLIEGKPGCGLGVIIRDHLGELVTAATDYIPGCLSVLMAETLAIRLAMKLAASRSLQNIFIASDNQSVITALKGQTRFNTDWGKILEDCIIASKNFNTLSFNFTPRKCNNVAHCLANWSRVAHVSDVWTSFLPDLE
ncbi:hypothetical protein F8388_002131 [Cannabis sativa]|uniref:RNase H type-1 domain-containing protein n=1 Tax=Cannabis sativa TaxID=3483 RepID=A0A7J6F1G1_CANSA|nr:hypothetical protein F8388_002131 [Cannabis sativa]